MSATCRSELAASGGRSHTSRIELYPTIPPHQPRNLLTILSLVSVGAGVSVIPRTLAAAGFPGVAFKTLRGEAPINEVSVVWRADNRSPVLARALQALGLAPARGAAA